MDVGKCVLSMITEIFENENATNNVNDFPLCWLVIGSKTVQSFTARPVGQ